MKKNHKTMVFNAILAALYVALCSVNPISFGAMQFRIANILVVLPLLNISYTPGVLLGIAFANAASPLGPVDIMCGLLAEGAAYFICWLTPAKCLGTAVKITILALCVAVVIGTELYMLYNAPILVTAAGLFFTTVISETVGYFMFTRSVLKKMLSLR